MKNIVHCLIERIRILFYRMNRLTNDRELTPHKDIEIDIIIPVIEKDLSVLPICIEGLRKYVNHKIKAIYIVAPDKVSIKDFCKINDLIFKNEDEILGYSPKDINYITVEGFNRSGWIFQQLIKLAGNIGTQPYYLVCDADHILLQKHTFITSSNKHVFYFSQEFNYPYYRSIYKLLKIMPFSLFSYISHKMIFNRNMVIALQEDIKKIHFKQWDMGILAILDKNYQSCFSEYELYGNYISKNNKVLLPWKECHFSPSQLESLNELEMKYSKKYRSITFSNYINEYIK